MNNGQNANLIWYALALILPLSALLARRIPMRGAIFMLIGWIAIFGLVLGIFSYRREIAQTAGQLQSHVINATSDQHSQGRNVHVSMAPDGHFWVQGEINGHSARFLIDSGATITALSDATARQAGLNVDTSGPGVIMHTANGTIQAQRSSIATLSVGPIRASDIGIVVSPAFGDTNVLGMNFLSRLKSWRVARDEMVLEQ